jgi:hypothetical protein
MALARPPVAVRWQTTIRALRGMRAAQPGGPASDARLTEAKPSDYPPIAMAKMCMAVTAPTPLLICGSVTKAGVLPGWTGIDAK